MTTRHLIDPELLEVLGYIPPLDLDPALLISLRSGFYGATQPQESWARDDVSVERMQVPGPAGAPDIGVWLHRPKQVDGALPVFLNIHGGGYVLGSAEQDGPANVRTAAEVGCLVVSPDYRLAPETVAPGSLEDCYAVLLWLYRHAESLGLDKDRIAVGGASAGGGLAAGLALLARDRGEVPLCFQLLIYPMIDDRTAIRKPEDDNPATGEFVWTRAANSFGWNALLGGTAGGQDVSFYTAPARAPSLAGLPPTYLCVGGLDLFLEEDTAYALRLSAAGIPTEFHIFPSAYHGFEMAAAAKISIAAEAERRAALTRAFLAPQTAPLIHATPS